MRDLQSLQQKMILSARLSMASVEVNLPGFQAERRRLVVGYSGKQYQLGLFASQDTAREALDIFYAVAALRDAKSAEKEAREHGHRDVMSGSSSSSSNLRLPL